MKLILVFFLRYSFLEAVKIEFHCLSWGWRGGGAREGYQATHPREKQNKTSKLDNISKHSLIINIYIYTQNDSPTT